MKGQENISAIEQYVIDYVRDFRNENNLTQEDIGAILEVSRSYIADIENPKSRAKYNMTHINLLAEHFQKSPKDFFPEKAFNTKPKSTRTKKVSKN